MTQQWSIQEYVYQLELESKIYTLKMPESRPFSSGRSSITRSSPENRETGSEALGSMGDSVSELADNSSKSESSREEMLLVQKDMEDWEILGFERRDR